MFDKKAYWDNRKEGIRGQGEERKPFATSATLPSSIRKYQRQKWSNPIFTKKYNSKTKLLEVKLAHRIRTKASSHVK